MVATAPKIKYCFSNSKYLAFRIFKGRVDYKVQKYFEWFVEKRLEEFTKDLGICLGFVMETFLTEAKMNCMSVVTESLLELLECCNSRAN